MNSSSYQPPQHATMATFPCSRMLWADLRRGQRLSLSRVSLISARFAAVDSRYWCWRTWMERLIEHCGSVRIEILPVLIVGHCRFLVGRIWHGNWHTYLTSTVPWSCGLTGCPEEGMLTLSGYQSSRQTGFGFYNESLAPDRAGLSRFTPNTDNTIPLLNTNFHRSFACFAFGFCSSGRRLFFSSEPFEGENWRCNHVTQSIEEQIGVFAAIESEAHLFQIGSKMLCANTMPCTYNSALQKGKSGFHRIGVDIPINIDFVPVADGLVTISVNLGLNHRFRISRPFIREHYFHICRDIFLDVLGERVGFGIPCMEKPQFASALTDANDYFFGVFPYLVSESSLFAANVGLIHLYPAIQHWLIGLGHSVPDAVAEIPCCFVTADSESALNLASGHALLGLTEQERCGEPLNKGQVGIIEYRSSGNGELIVAILAVEQLLFGFEFDHGSLAAEAARAFREAQARQKFSALLFGMEHRVYVH